MSTSDFSDLLRLFENSETRYLIVGGHAVMSYTEPRFTKDLDIWVDQALDNAERVQLYKLRTLEFSLQSIGSVRRTFGRKYS